MRAAEVRDVEALDPHRRHVEPERLLQALERLDATLAAALGAQALLVERQARVALGELQDAALVAALGRAQLDRRRRAGSPSASCERVALGEGELALDDDQRGDRDVPGVVLQHELLRHLRQLALGLVGEIEGLAVGEHAVADLEDLRVGLARRRARPRPRRACRPTRSATRWRSSSECTARRRLRSSVACSNS